jgi:hypothetical protein
MRVSVPKIDGADRTAITRRRTRPPNAASLANLLPPSSPLWVRGDAANPRGPLFGSGRGEVDRRVGQRPLSLSDDEVRAGVAAVLDRAQALRARRVARAQARKWIALQLRTPAGALRMLEAIAKKETTR